MDQIFQNEGMSKTSVLALMNECSRTDANWKEGKTWSMVYFAGDEIEELIRTAYSRFIYTNGLGPTTFHSIRQFETEVLAMTSEMLMGDSEVVGSLTTGGSESIFMAVKTARDFARVNRPEVTNPEMCIPLSAHPAFDKAAHYLGIKVVRTPLNENFEADVFQFEKAINENTIFTAGSAIGYPHGILDNIELLSEIALKKGVWFHTDACLGGFVLPWMKSLGKNIYNFDFSLPGVTSISCDQHKYGFAARGASSVLYRNSEYRKHQFYVETEWPGGIYATPTMTGSRPGGAIAAAWAVMKYFGKNGYKEIVKEMLETTEKLKKGIESIDGLKILGNPPMTVFSFASDTINVYALAEEMRKKGWHLERQHLPPCLHLMVTPAHTPIVDQFLKDLNESVEATKLLEEKDISMEAVMYGMLGTMPDRSMAKEMTLEYMDKIFKPGTLEL